MAEAGTAEEKKPLGLNLSGSLAPTEKTRLTGGVQLNFESTDDLGSVKPTGLCQEFIEVISEPSKYLDLQKEGGLETKDLVEAFKPFFKLESDDYEKSSGALIGIAFWVGFIAMAFYKEAVGPFGFAFRITNEGTPQALFFLLAAMFESFIVQYVGFFLLWYMVIKKTQCCHPYGVAGIGLVLMLGALFGIPSLIGMVTDLVDFTLLTLFFTVFTIVAWCTLIAINFVLGFHLWKLHEARMPKPAAPGAAPEAAAETETA